MSSIVLKFGGSSLCPDGIENMVNQIQLRIKEGYQVIVVLSAVNNTTNHLYDLIHMRSYKSSLESIKTEHLKLCKTLKIKPDLFNKLYDNLVLDIELLHSNSSIDLIQHKIKILSFGEIASTYLLSSYLEKQGIDLKLVNARNFIQNKSKSDRIDPDTLSISGKFMFNTTKFNTIMNDYQVILTQGFIASTSDKKYCVLTRSGSDTSASIIANGINADKLEIWTDVNGIYTADPRRVPTARIIPKIAYNVCQEASAMGSQVIHPYCIRPCKEKHIPIFIRNSFNPRAESTMINGIEAGKNDIYLISYQDNVTVFQIKSLDMWSAVGFAANIFSVFGNTGIDIDIITSAEFMVVITTKEQSKVKLNRAQEELDRNYDVNVISDCATISVIADNVNSNSDIRKAHSMLDHFKHPIHITQNSANNLSLSFVVDSSIGEKLLTFLHRELIERNNEHIDNVNAWWTKERKSLIKLYEKEDNESMYVYSLNKVNTQIKKLQENLTCIDHLYYAMKANYNKDIIGMLTRNGFGLEVVSIGELNYAKTFTDDILFTPNFCNKNDYEIGFMMNCHVTVDNIDVLQNNPKIFQNKKFCLRLDCGVGGGHHHKVNTEGKQAKFGIPIEQLEEVLKLSKKYDFKIIGLQSHKGSGILDSTAWTKTAKVMLEYIKGLDLSDLKYLDLGGGLGVWKDGVELDLVKMNESLTEIKKEIQKYYPKIRFHLEPGRYMVAEAGVIIAKVNHIKQKGKTKFIGLSVGMNGLMRPVLYNSYHPIHNLSNYDSNKKTEICDIVGPICETGDVFLRKHKIEKTNIGDIVLIDIAGAYGSTMSSNYNMIPIPKEYAIDICYASVEE